MVHNKILKHFNKSHKINNNTTEYTQEKSVGAMGYGNNEERTLLKFLNDMTVLYI